jgi:hypothetical protein
MIEILTFTLWTLFIAYTTWYLTKAKHYAPITHTEARMLWKIHKHTHQCNEKRWREIKRGSKTIGFECGCGYTHVQQRPIVGNLPSPETGTQETQFLIVNRLHTPYKST